MLNKQYDACVTWTSGQGDIDQGFSRGALRGMVDRGMLKMSDVNIIWKSGKIPNGPWGLRCALPARPQGCVHGVHDGPAEVAQGYLRRRRARLRRGLCSGHDGPVQGS